MVGKEHSESQYSECFGLILIFIHNVNWSLEELKSKQNLLGFVSPESWGTSQFHLNICFCCMFLLFLFNNWLKLKIYMQLVKEGDAYNSRSFKRTTSHPSSLPLTFPSLLPSSAWSPPCIGPTAAQWDASNPLLMNLVNGPPAAHFGSVN